MCHFFVRRFACGHEAALSEPVRCGAHQRAAAAAGIANPRNPLNPCLAHNTDYLGVEMSASLCPNCRRAPDPAPPRRRRASSSGGRDALAEQLRATGLGRSASSRSSGGGGVVGSGAREPFANGYLDRADPFAALNQPFAPPHGASDFDARVPRDMRWGGRAHRTREGYARDQGRPAPGRGGSGSSSRAAPTSSSGSFLGMLFGRKRSRRE